MLTLYHLPLCPFSRKVRLALAEKKISFDLVTEYPWDQRPEFLALNPAGEVPVLVTPENLVLSDATAICEYLDEGQPEPALIGRGLEVRAEVRRLVGWFDAKFNREVTSNLVGEKLHKRQRGGAGGPDSRMIRIGYQLIRQHLDYVGWLTERRRWLAGDSFSLADITAAAHLSCVDYIGDVPWDSYPAVKDWYVRIKSRPSFRPLLADHISGIAPPKYYDDLDF
jgi:glutathione S-transferase